MKKALLLTAILSLSAVIVACSPSIEEEKKKTIDEVKEIFQDQPKNTNEEIDELSFRLPFNTSIEEEDQHNIVLEKGNDPFVLFHHRNTEAGNESVYHMTTATEESWLVNETFTEDGRFGYVLVRQVEEEKYELVTGADYVKLTTVSSLGDLSKKAKWMMETARSVEWQDK
ncbi:hypothetical protein [Jeotgalibacillus campisalis]|uniref:Lipoprotein n=1 Tax=Jeotgalibacillus campisalis TaxID=220754 RepID=A0A0C2VPJ5_9BACL|nr:hypothetical protein [Jeotgalibacillus campisalis]KIL46371.1 hypothetical protein KR50_30460 [Jeotgalibacillus campisalis]